MNTVELQGAVKANVEKAIARTDKKPLIYREIEINTAEEHNSAIPVECWRDLVSVAADIREGDVVRVKGRVKCRVSGKGFRWIKVEVDEIDVVGAPAGRAKPAAKSLSPPAGGEADDPLPF